MSQPPESTMRAPSARWASLRTVFWVIGTACGCGKPPLSRATEFLARDGQQARGTCRGVRCVQGAKSSAAPDRPARPSPLVAVALVEAAHAGGGNRLEATGIVQPPDAVEARVPLSVRVRADDRHDTAVRLRVALA